MTLLNFALIIAVISGVLMIAYSMWLFWRG